MVERDEDGAHFGSVDHLELGVPAQAGDVLRRQVGQHVDVARQQRGNARRVGLDRGVDHFGHVAIVLVPPVAIDGHRDLLVGLPAGDLVGAGAVHVARGVVVFLGLVVLGVGGLVLFRPGLAHDPEVDDVAQQDRARRRKHHIDRVVVDLLDLADSGDVDLHRALRLLDPAEREDHVVGGEGRAVVELDALAQFEANLGRADDGPLGGQGGLDLVVLGVACQSLVGVHQDRVGRGVVLGMRVQSQYVVLRGPAQRGRVDCANRHAGSD